MRKTQVQFLGQEEPLAKRMQPSLPFWRQGTPVFLPGEFHKQRSPVGYSPWGHKESDTTKWLTLLLLCIIHKAKTNRIEGENRQFYTNSWRLQYATHDNEQNHQTEKKEREKLHNTINQLDQTDTHRPTQQKQDTHAFQMDMSHFPRQTKCQPIRKNLNRQ